MRVWLDCSYYRNVYFYYGSFRQKAFVWWQWNEFTSQFWISFVQYYCAECFRFVLATVLCNYLTITKSKWPPVNTSFRKVQIETCLRFEFEKKAHSKTACRKPKGEFRYWYQCDFWDFLSSKQNSVNKYFSRQPNTANLAISASSLSVNKV